MKFINKKEKEKINAEVGDLIIYRHYNQPEEEHRLICMSSDSYFAVNIENGISQGRASTLSELVDKYKNYTDFRIVKNKNLQLIEV